VTLFPLPPIEAPSRLLFPFAFDPNFKVLFFPVFFTSRARLSGLSSQASSFVFFFFFSIFFLTMAKIFLFQILLLGVKGFMNSCAPEKSSFLRNPSPFSSLS